MEEKLYDLTNPQKSIWVMEQFYKGTAINNVCGTLIIHEPVNFGLFIEAIKKTFETNDNFHIRLTFNKETGSIAQYYANDFDLNTTINELETDDDLRKLEGKVVSIPFPLIESQLFNLTLFRFQNNHGGFIINAHHLVADACTADLVASKIMDTYSSLVNGTELNDNSSSYLNYMNSEKEYILSEKFNKDKAYWDSVFDTVPNIASLSANNTASNSCIAKREEYEIDKDTVAKLNKFCRENKITVFSFLMSVYAIYIGKVKELNDFVIGTPILNRTNYAEKHTTGMFISTIPFKFSIGTNTSFMDLASSVAVQIMGMLRHQKYPYQSLLADIRKKDSSIPNLYNIMISYQDSKTNNNTCSIPYNVRWTHSTYTSDELDIHLFDMNNTGELHIAYDYQVDKYTGNDILEIHNHIINIIKQILDYQQYDLSKLELVTPDEKNYLLNKYNCGSYTEIKKTVIDLFMEQASIHPNTIALADGNETITYAELDNLSNNICQYLKNRGIKPHDNVCLFFPNTINLVASILGILKIGACYIPMDVAYPFDRISYIVKDSTTQFILTDKEHCEGLQLLQNNSILINYKDFINNQNLDEEKIKSTLPSTSDLAYIIYTSGSTGKPKGVKICHESLCNYITWAKDTYVHGEVTNFPLYSSIAFDLTVTSIYTPLISGNGIYVYRNQNPQMLLQNILNDNKVQIIKLTPAHLSLLLDCIPSSTVTKLILGGDILNIEICKKITELFSNNIHIFNEYGPTESTVGCMIYEYQNTDNQYYASVPIGIPAQNTKLFVLNNNFNLVPFEQEGQLYISGKGLSKGYVNLEEKTRERFLQSPFDKNEKIYQTGDIVILHRNGIMEYIGRSDFQIKLNGFRIEIGEIQSKILSYPNIKDCFVTPIEKNSRKLLCAYYISKKSINTQELKKYLKQSLTTYMIPKYFIEVDSLPLTNNGKIDKKKLPMPTDNETIIYEAPQNNIEKEISNVLCKLLDIDKFSVTANIFDYYVDSLVIIKAQTILFNKGFDLTVQDFYDHQTIRSLAKYLNDKVNNNIGENEDENLINDIKSIQKPISIINRTDNILLFGATGYLGIHILYQLLTETNSKIYCIVRDREKLNSYQRLKNKFNFYYAKENIMDTYSDRIVVISGNLLEDNFALYDNVYSKLSTEIDCVISTAAVVKHYGNYEEFYETNVLGTKKIVDFCKQFNKPLHYVSTMSISGYGLVKAPKTTFTENNFYIGQNYQDNVYVKSKFEAERLIINECKDNNLNASIYRIGNITNRFTDGAFQQNYKDNAFVNRLLSIIRLKCIPKELENLDIEFTPVDYCSRFIVKLLDKMQNNINIYHLYDNKGISLSHLMKTLEENNIKIAEVPFTSFENEISKDSSKYFGIVNYINVIKNPDFNKLELSNDQTNKLLKDQNLEWPDISEEYIKKIINYLLQIMD